mmetsp:Transcript_10016/g.18035  ORF Transcript_10016/g.18035 Transcript_10016/m.18035 type:complete len:276 (+) Transcript_10016:913-1740(+)
MFGFVGQVSSAGVSSWLGTGTARLNSSGFRTNLCSAELKTMDSEKVNVCGKQSSRVHPSNIDGPKSVSQLNMGATLYDDQNDAPLLRTFLSTPESSTVYELDGTPVDLNEVVVDGQHSGTVVVWLRHYGCSLCRKLMSEIDSQIHSSLKDINFKLIAVGPGSCEHAEATKNAVGFTGDILSDPLRTTYRALSFKRGVGVTFNLPALKAIIGSFKKGYQQDWLMIPEDPFALGGVLVLDDKGFIRFKHIEQFAGDHPLPSDVLNVCKKLVNAPVSL